jgi:hypothetical protein
MKNINQIKSRYTMWLSIDNFPTYKELVELSFKYYNKTVVYCFSNKEKDLYVIKFKLLDDNSFELEYSYFIYAYNMFDRMPSAEKSKSYDIFRENISNNIRQNKYIFQYMMHTDCPYQIWDGLSSERS